MVWYLELLVLYLFQEDILLNILSYIFLYYIIIISYSLFIS